MKKNLGVCFLFITIAFCKNSFGQNKCGFVNEAGKEIIKAIYEDAKDFSEGLAPVKLDGKWGFIDKAGQVVIPFQYSDVSTFREGYAFTCKAGEDCKYIDKSGKVAINTAYTGGYRFYDGVAIISQKGLWGAIDKTGKQVIPIKYENVTNYSEGVFGVKLYGLMGFVDNKGNSLTSIKYKQIMPFMNGAAWAVLNNELFLITRDGEKKITTAKGYDIKPDNFAPFGIARVKEGENYFLVTKSGRIIKGLGGSNFEWVGPYTEEMIPVRDKTSAYFIDVEGRLVSKKKYAVVGPYFDGVAWVSDNELSYYGIDKNEKVVTDKYYDTHRENFSEGLAAVKKDDKWGFINTKGKMVIKAKYDKVESFSNGFAAVEINGYEGFINTSGKEITKMKYYTTEPFCNGFAQVQDFSYNRGYINTEGDEVIPVRYDSFSEDCIKNGIVWAEENSLFIILDASGKPVTGFKYIKHHRFYDGMALVVRERN